MSENRPLTKEEREELHIQKFDHEEIRFLVNRLFDSESYWREAVKNCQPVECHGNGLDVEVCAFCRNDGFSQESISHTTDCPWKLAQES